MSHVFNVLSARKDEFVKHGASSRATGMSVKTMAVLKELWAIESAKAAPKPASCCMIQ